MLSLVARCAGAWLGPIPHQFLLNDIESILPGPLELVLDATLPALCVSARWQAIELRIVAYRIKTHN
jgi:hypothetical protein